MLSRILSLIFAFSLIFTVAFAADDNDPVLGKAGDYIVKKSDLDRLISYYPAKNRQFLENSPQQKLTLVKRMLEVKIISDIAREKEFTNRPEVKEQLQFMTNDFIAREYLTKSVMSDLSVTDEDIRQYYDLNKEKFTTPEQIRARHILVKVAPTASEEEKKAAREKAEEILEKLEKGEDFAKLAEEFSDDPGSKSKGGDLGYLSKGRMVKAFEDAAFALKPGETSGIVETNFGFHVIKVEDYKEGQLKPFDEVKEQIRAELSNSFAKSKAEEFISTVTKEAGMEIYADKIAGKTGETGETAK